MVAGIGHGIRSLMIAAFSVGVVLACTAPGWAAEGEAKKEAKPEKAEPVMPDVDWVLEHNLDDKGKGPQPEFRKTKGWKMADYTGTGAVKVEDGTVILGMGNEMTGVKWHGPITRMNYEITLDAKRVDGGDFFCGLTFPYGEDPCSFIVGGWGGTCVGISSIDFYDAYNNETARFREFELNRWYRIRVRVTEGKIEAWIDDDQLVNLDVKKRKIGIRWEMQACVPLGIATWRTTGAIRNIRMAALPAPVETAPQAK